MELLIKATNAEDGKLYKFEDGQTYRACYRVCTIAKHYQTEELLVLCFRMEGVMPMEALIFPLSVFTAGRFQEIYNLGEDLEVLALAVDIFEDLWSLRVEQPQLLDSFPKKLQNIGAMCQKMKGILVQAREEQS